MHHRCLFELKNVIMSAKVLSILCLYNNISPSMSAALWNYCFAELQVFGLTIEVGDAHAGGPDESLVESMASAMRRV